jgi:hypothetical protein
MKAITLSLALFSISCLIALAWILGTPAPTDPRVARLETDLKEARQTISQLRRELAEKPAPAPARTMTSAPSIDAPSAAGSPVNGSPTATPVVAGNNLGSGSALYSIAQPPLELAGNALGTAARVEVIEFKPSETVDTTKTTTGRSVSVKPSESGNEKRANGEEKDETVAILKPISAKEVTGECETTGATEQSAREAQGLASLAEEMHRAFLKAAGETEPATTSVNAGSANVGESAQNRAESAKGVTP